MSLILYYHPLASFCHKVLIALYENGTPFHGQIVDLGDPVASAEFFKLWPVGKIPLLRDASRGRTIPETTIIIEYVGRHHPGAAPLLPSEEDTRLDVRLWDRFFDTYVQIPMQKIVGDRLRAEDDKDPKGVGEARATLETAYGMIEAAMADRTWIAGDGFSMADCAAAPALFYADIVAPFSETHPNIAAYFERLVARPSVARVLEEAKPYFQYFPFRAEMPARFL
jgi:glutathione S-transferase